MFKAPDTGRFAKSRAADHPRWVDRREASILLASTIVTLAAGAAPALASDSNVVKAPPAAVPELPELKLPAPRPSARYTYTDRFMSGFRDKPARTLMSTLEGALLDVNYPDVYHFACSSGLAMWLPFESIEDDRTSSFGNDRFGIQNNGRPKDYRDGYFTRRLSLVRSVLWILAINAPSPQHYPTKFSKQHDKVGRGFKSLDPQLRTPTVTLEHELRAFFYEWTVGGGPEPTFVRTSPFIGDEHLNKMRMLK